MMPTLTGHLKFGSEEENFPPRGEVLADKGFQGVDRLMSNFNQVRCPKVLMKSEVKQCEQDDLDDKGDCCRLRYTSEVDFSFF